ncbi:MAG TPA: hypothetical protein V6D08_17615 [Candidatus Obscuribacterales bacterium]
MEPIAIFAEGPNKYKVRFQTDRGEEDCGVIIETSKVGDVVFPVLVGDSEFLDITEGDPAADQLRDSIFALHAARHFEYSEDADLYRC